MAWMQLCKLSELKEGEGKVIEASGLQVAVFCENGRLRAFDDYCPHAGASLSGGQIEDGHVICPWHYWAFNLDTGKLAPSGHAGIRVYPCRKSADGVWVEAQLPVPLPASAARTLDLEAPKGS